MEDFEAMWAAVNGVAQSRTRLKRLRSSSSSSKDPPAMQETWIQSLGPEDPLEKLMSTHSSILAWRIPMDRGADGLQFMGLQRVGHN